MKKILIPLSILLVLAQWMVPAQMIWKKESIYVKGTDYKFRTEPIDPVNPFIGRYIVLRFRDREQLMKVQDAPKSVDDVYVTFKKNKEGFAVIDQVLDTPPARKDYLETSIDKFENKDGVTVTVDYPFNRFYMEETKAPEAEMTYASSNVDTSAKVYALVSLYKGDAAIKNVFVNDTAIAEMVKKNRNIR